MKRIIVTLPDALKRKLDEKLDNKERNTFLVNAIKAALAEREAAQQPSSWNQFKEDSSRRWKKFMDMM